MRNAGKQIPQITAYDKARFFARVDKRPDGIWHWTGKRNHGRYGIFMFGREEFSAHRVSWVINERDNGRSGIIPENLHVLHRNDVTKDSCDVNPANLWLGTNKDNCRDMINKGRQYYGIKPRGEQHPRAKLNRTKVEEIRKRRANGETYKSIGAALGVVKETVRMVITGRTWNTSI